MSKKFVVEFKTITTNRVTVEASNEHQAAVMVRSNWTYFPETTVSTFPVIDRNSDMTVRLALTGRVRRETLLTVKPDDAAWAD